MKEFPIKFRSLRDKNASHRRSKSVPAGTKETKVSRCSPWLRNRLDFPSKLRLLPPQTPKSPVADLSLQSRPPSAEALRAMFKMDGPKQSSKQEAEIEATKVRLPGARFLTPPFVRCG